jgi:hypothetical protein
VVLHEKQSVLQLRSFAAWLPKHLQLVRSIHAKIDPTMLKLATKEHNVIAMGQQLQTALRAAAAAAAAAQVADTPPAPAAQAAAEAAPAAGSSAAVTAQGAPRHQQQQQRQGWRLTSFSCNMPGAAGTLAALPAHSLTHLELGLPPGGSGLGRALASLLPLQGLQHLDLLADFPQQQLVQLTQLPALQHLVLRYRSMSIAAGAAEAWAQLPQLREILIDGEGYDRKLPTIDAVDFVMEFLPGCSGLTKLVLFCNPVEECVDDNPYGYNDPYNDSSSDEDSYSEGSGNWNFAYVAAAVCESLEGLTGLRDLSITCDGGGLEYGDALALTALTGLTRLELDDVSHGVNTAAACLLASSLTQLRDLAFGMYCDVDMTSAEFLDALGQLTQLTRLKLYANQKLTQQGLMQLTGLSRLQDLQVPMSGPFSSSEITATGLAEFWAAVRQQQ